MNNFLFFFVRIHNSLMITQNKKHLIFVSGWISFLDIFPLISMLIFSNFSRFSIELRVKNKEKLLLKSQKLVRVAWEFGKRRLTDINKVVPRWHELSLQLLRLNLIIFVCFMLLSHTLIQFPAMKRSATAHTPLDGQRLYW